MSTPTVGLHSIRGVLRCLDCLYAIWLTGRPVEACTVPQCGESECQSTKSYTWRDLAPAHITEAP